MNKKNPSASAYARLLSRAQQTNRPFQELLVYYGIERFLYRLSQSRYANQFILKGALLFHVWQPKVARATRDIDFLGHFKNEIGKVTGVVKEICLIEVQDGLKFGSTVTAEKIKEDAEYEGIRTRFVGHLASAKIPMQLDIGFGDVLTPGSTKIEYPTLLESPPLTLRGYPKESVVAEKFHALVELGLLNSRLKDFYDLWFLARGFYFDGSLLTKAITETFKRRKTLMDSAPIALAKSFSQDSGKQAQWKAFVKRTRLELVLANFEDVVDILAGFLLPVWPKLVKREFLTKDGGKRQALGFRKFLEIRIATH